MKQLSAKDVLWGLTVLLYVGKAALFFAFINCGIDISDEGQFLMGCRYPQEYSTFPYYQFVAPVLGSILGDVVYSRLFKVVLETAVVSLVSGSIYLWVVNIRKELSGWKLYAEIWLAASLASFTFVFARVTSYDDFVGLFPAAGLFFFSAALFRKKISRSTMQVFYLLSGFFLGCMIFIKAPVLITVLLAFVVVVAVFLWQSKKLVLGALVSMHIGVALSLLVGIWLVGGMAVLSADLEVVLQMSALSAYNFDFMLTNYLHRDVPYLFFILISMSVLFLWIRKNPSPVRWLVWCALTVCFAGVLYLRDINFSPVAYQHVFLFLLFSGLSGLSCFLLPEKLFTEKTNAFVALLWCFPFLLAAGTANSIFENASLYMAVFYALAYVAVAYHLPSGALKYFLVFVLLSAGYFVHTQVIHPYGLPTTIIYQNQVTLLFNERIKTDSASAMFFNKIYASLKSRGYKAGDEIIALDALTGVASTVGAKMPVTLQWINGSDGINCYLTGRLTLHRKKPFVLTGQDMSPTFENCLRESEINFPQSYILADVIYNPYKRAYKIHYGEELNDSIRIYAPVNF